MIQDIEVAQEFVRPIRVDKLDDEGLTVTIEANGVEREALARRFELDGIESFSATVSVNRATAGAVRVSGVLDAIVLQTCVVSLEPMVTEIHEPFSAVLKAGLEEESPSGEVEVSLDEDEADDVLSGNEIDIGELAAQQLALVLDPYPRRPDAALDAYGGSVVSTGEIDVSSASPFAVLAALKDKQG